MTGFRERLRIAYPVAVGRASKLSPLIRKMIALRFSIALENFVWVCLTG